MDIRSPEPHEAGTLARIHRSARAAAMPWLPVVHTTEEDDRFFRDHVLPSQTVLLAQFDGQIAGFIAYKKDWINHLYIAPRNWRHGIGAKLLTRAMRGAESFQLWTFQGNHSARAFYAKFGFVEVELTDGSENEERTPDVRMIWHAGLQQ